MIDNLNIFISSSKQMYLSIDSSKLDDYIHAYNNAEEDVYGIHISEYHGYELDNLGFLGKLKKVKKLFLQSIPSDISQINALNELVVLDLGEEVNQTVDLLNFPKLVDFSCVWSNKIKNIGQSTQLKNLYLSKYKAKTFSIVEFQKLTNIIELSLIQSNIKTLDGIEKLEKLQSLYLGYLRNLIDISSIANIGVKDLHFESCKKIVDYSTLATLENLNTLDIENSGDIESIKFIQGMKNLEKLFFVNSNLLDGNISPCLLNKNIKKVDFSNKKHYTHSKDELDILINKRGR